MKPNIPAPYDAAYVALAELLRAPDPLQAAGPGDAGDHLDLGLWMVRTAELEAHDRALWTRSSNASEIQVFEHALATDEAI
jgi:hypothetical protein